MTFYHDSFIESVSRTIAMHAMLEPEDSVLVGVSGGPDSMALLYALIEMSPELSFTLSIAHFNHGIRGADADNDEHVVRSLSQKLGIPCYTRHGNVPDFKKTHGLSMEEAARELRYTFFFDLAKEKGFTKIALGHHADDNAEQVLMNLLRGSGPTGLAGIPPKRGDKIVRPLIHSSRDDIDTFVRNRNIEYVRDSSNQDKRYLRNKIRHHLLPLLKESYNTEIKKHLNRLARIVTDEDSWVKGRAKAEFDQHAIVDNDKSIFLNIKWLNDIPIAFRRRMLRHAIHVAKGNLRKIGFDHIEAVLMMAKTSSGHKCMDLPDGVRVEAISDLIKIYQIVRRKGRPVLKQPEVVPFCYHFFASGFKPGAVSIPEIGATLTFSMVAPGSVPDVSSPPPGVACLDMDRIGFPITVRNIQPGDRFTPLGMSGSQKVKKFFINNKIAKHNRLSCPVLLSGEKIIWLAGYRISDHVKVTHDTAKVLKVELLLAK